jgi:tricorn protease
MAATSYLRSPHLAHDLLTFTAEDDVWLAPVSGGRASRLTADRTPVRLPNLSPDGSHVAWTSTRDGAVEVYAVAVDGGRTNRLTYWGDRQTRPLGWLSDTEVAVASGAGHHRGMRAWAHGISLDGATRPLPYGPLTALGFGPDSAVLVGSSYFNPPAYWKRYGGGTGGKIWLDRDGSGRFGQILADVGNHLVNPMFVGGRIAFLSDHEGVGALYSADLDAGDLRRHTGLGDFYARDAATDGSRVVYGSAGDLWLLESLDAEPRKLDIALGGARSGREPFNVHPAHWLGGYDLGRTGRVAAAEVRGTVHWLPAQDGPARPLLAEPGVRGRLPLVVPGRSAVLCVSDAGGEDGLELIPADGSPARRFGHGRLGRITGLAISPDGRTAAVANGQGQLLTVDLGPLADAAASAVGADPGTKTDTDTGTGTAGTADLPPDPVVTELTRVGIDQPQGLAFSPDSSHLAWAQPWTGERGTHIAAQIKLARLADRTIVDVTAARFDSWSPAFTHDGKHLAFLSNQAFDPVYDAHLFDLGFLPGARPYLVTLAEDTPSPFAPQLNGRPSPAQAAQEAKQAKKPTDAADAAGEQDDSAAVDPVRVDLNAISDRIVPFPVEAGDYSGLAAVENGVVWLSHATRGELGEGAHDGGHGDPAKPELIRYDLAKRKRTTLVGELDSFTVSGDGTRIGYRKDGDFTIKAADGSGEDEAISVGLDRIRVRVDPVSEWTQMYQEIWRVMRDKFWRPDMNGVDWEAMSERYRPLLARLGSADDFNDLGWELVGELGTSHCYVIGPMPGADPAGAQGMLGADLAADPDGGGWRIDRILPGESSVAGGRSPLAAPGVAARPGDLITAVDGRPVDPVRGPNPLLAGKADQPVELTLRRAGAGGGPGAERRVVVVPVRSDQTLRYHDLIKSRRAKVRELSGGRLGYLHVPDMQSPGWAEFHRDLATEIQCDGLIFDLRENGGGHTSALVVEKLTRKIIAWELSRQHQPVTYPVDAPRGPIVTLTDEMAGSDGDIGTAAVKAYGLGPVVGTRTWGGVIGYDGDYHLVDGTLITQPRLAFWFAEQGWSVENYGVDPDVEVQIPPHDWAAGRDPQLETAVRLALEALETNPPAQPPTIPPLPNQA